MAITIAVDLLAWLRLLACHNLGELAKAEPKTLRYRLLTIPARIVRGQRLRTLRLPRHWPWSNALAEVITTVRGLPLARPG